MKHAQRNSKKHSNSPCPCPAWNCGVSSEAEQKLLPCLAEGLPCRWYVLLSVLQLQLPAGRQRRSKGSKLLYLLRHQLRKNQLRGVSFMALEARTWTSQRGSTPRSHALSGPNLALYSRRSDSACAFPHSASRRPRSASCRGQKSTQSIKEVHLCNDRVIIIVADAAHNNPSATHPIP